MAQDRGTTNTQSSRSHGAAKRTFDLVVVLPLVVVAIPVIAFAAVGSLLTLRAFPFFAQHRVGKDQQPFTVVKIRTLPACTPRYAAKYDLKGVDTPTFTRWLRKTHVDELPQLFQVLSGKMSLVGPRPEMALLHGNLSDADARARTSIRPGCTGLWQVSCDAKRLIHEALEYDDFYLKHRTLRLDAWIVLQTVLVAVFRRTPIELSDVPVWATSEGWATSSTNDRLVPTSVD